MTRPGTQVPTLVVGDWGSWCSACGGRAVVDAPPLLHGRTPDPHVPGCGVEFAAVAYASDASAELVQAVRAMADTTGLAYAGQWPQRPAGGDR